MASLLTEGNDADSQHSTSNPESHVSESASLNEGDNTSVHSTGNCDIAPNSHVDGSQTNVEQEQKKQVFSGVKVRFLQGFLLHGPAVSGCLIILSLSWIRMFWLEGDDTTKLNALQFAAKLQELFVVLSLGTMAIHHSKKHLLDPEGLPLGLLTSGYRIGDLWLLVEPSFCQALLKKGARRLGLFVVICTLLSLLIGPATAIVMLPTQGWSQIPRPFDNINMPIQFLEPIEKMWPTSIGSESVDEMCGEPDSLDFQEWKCPFGNFQQIASWFKGPSYQRPSSEFNIQEHWAENQRKVLTGRLGNGLAISTTASRRFTITMSRLWHIIEKERWDSGVVNRTQRPRFRTPNSAVVYQPFVQVQCEYFDRTSNGDGNPTNWTTRPSFRSDKIHKFSTNQAKWVAENSEESWPVPESFLNISNLGGPPVMDWIPDDFSNHSIAAIVTLPSPRRFHGWENFSTGYLDSILLPCVIDATWIPASLSFDPVSNQLVTTNITSSIGVLQHGVEPGSKMSIDTSWTDLLNIMPRDMYSNSSFAQVLFNRFVWTDAIRTEAHRQFITGIYRSDGNRELEVSETVSQVLATFLADALSAIGSQAEPPQVRVSKISDSGDHYSYWESSWGKGGGGSSLPGLLQENTTELYSININIERFGYSYGANVAAVRFAMSVICTYLAIFFIYVGYATYDQFSERHPWSISPWSSIPDLLVLALNSMPSPKLKNTGAGVESTRLWGLRVRIKANQEEELQMDVDEREGLIAVVPGKEYG